MVIKVRLNTNINDKQSHINYNIEHQYDCPLTINELMSHLDISKKEVMVVSVNGIRADSDTLVDNGDEIIFYPAVLGG